MQRDVFPCPVPCHWVHLQSPKNNKSKRQSTQYFCKVQKACFLQISHRKHDINWGITYLSHLSFFCVLMTFRGQRTLHWWALLPSCSKCPLRSAWPCLFFPYMMKRQEWNKVQNALFSLYKIWISWLFSCCLCVMFRVRGPVLTHAFFVRFSPDNIKSCLYQPAKWQTLFGGRRRYCTEGWQSENLINSFERLPRLQRKNEKCPHFLTDQHFIKDPRNVN